SQPPAVTAPSMRLMASPTSSVGTGSTLRPAGTARLAASFFPPHAAGPSAQAHSATSRTTRRTGWRKLPSGDDHRQAVAGREGGHQADRHREPGGMVERVALEDQRRDR